MITEIEVRLREIVCERLDVKPDQVTSDASLITDLGADSLDIVDLAMALESEFSLRIHDTDYPNFLTFASATAYIHTRVSARQAALAAAPSPA
jgi:acyl carrier protein